MKVYYAHSMHLYNTPQEKRDIELLQKLGYEVVNPNSKEIQLEVEEYRKGKENYMDYFNKLLDSCDCIVFRAHVDGKIPSGVGTEVKYMIEKEKPVFQLPNLLTSDFLNVEDTRNYLKLNGQR